MKQTVLRLSVALPVIIALICSPMAFAQQAALTDEEIERIANRCVAAQVNMQRIQYSDTAARINRGQSYESLLADLMGPFNSRMAINRLDSASQFSDITSSLEATFTDFKRNYTQYEDALSDTLNINCKDQPVTFYDSLTKTRELRAVLAGNVDEMDRQITEYETALKQLQVELADEGTRL